ncbi:putative 2-dehydropantoate 2-reductase [Cytospora mali]|uniref:2-dehydropantoate 2-reductase n=1 Tax=Cytospora mali TaxID=578113 RepID=A0A194VFU5_CYTMA|nr:putative 2-dehydropantoate 2-reductase [Valsa mali var. pyri (nom. inval.)]
MGRQFSQRSTGEQRTMPQWLQTILKDTSPPPRPYAWTIENLGRPQTSEKYQTRGSSTHSDPDRRVFVLGLGNLGRLYAACLAQLPNPPPITLVVHRRTLLEHWASNPGIEITRHGILEKLSDFDIEWWTDERPSVGPVREIANGGRISNLIVATKAPDAIPQADSLRRYLKASSTVVFVQNGVNRLWPPYGEAYNAHRYPENNHPNWLHGITMHGVYSEGPFSSVHASPADVVIGPVCPNQTQLEKLNYLTELITQAPHLAGREVSRSQLWILQLEKLVINMIINPLSAVLRVKNGELFADPDGEVNKVMDVLLQETSSVLQALLRHESSKEVLLDDEMSQEALVQRFSVPNLRQMLDRIGEKVKHNKSSMFQDIETGKQTEIREFNGWLIETAKSLEQSLDVSSHRVLIDLVEQRLKLDKAELGRRLLPCS